jgi:plasmid stabilization system protein ParE
MVKQITWSDEAELIFDQISEYLLENYSMQTATRFADAVYDKIDTLVKYPDIGRISSKDDKIRYVIVDKHRQMFYEFDGTELTIIYFWDMRRDPKKRKY